MTSTTPPVGLRPLQSTPIDPNNPSAGSYFSIPTQAEVSRAGPAPTYEAPRAAPALADIALTPPVPPATSASPQAAAAVVSANVVHPTAARKGDRTFELQYPVDISGVRYERFTLHRLKWAAFEEALGAAISGDKVGQTSNQIMQARICRVPIDVIQELDWEDGMNLAQEVDDMYPLARLAKARDTGQPSSKT
jgi:Phage tail assembly chaperone proteins, E, or 41 or 14